MTTKAYDACIVCDVGGATRLFYNMLEPELYFFCHQLCADNQSIYRLYICPCGEDHSDEIRSMHERSD